jgi:hypothetical protein
MDVKDFNEEIQGITFYYPEQEAESAGLIRSAIVRSADLLMHHWNLPQPADCRVYLMTSWRGFLFTSAPWYVQPYLVTAYPFIAIKASRTWQYAGGWALRYGKRYIVGIKPPRLLESSNQAPGELIYVPDRSLKEKVQTITSHELTHAYTFHLKLPVWLNEGLAMRAMEHYIGRSVVREDTLRYLDAAVIEPIDQLRLGGVDGWVPLYSRGYWLTRYIEESNPDLLLDLLSRRHTDAELENALSTAYGIETGSLWSILEDRARHYFV